MGAAPFPMNGPPRPSGSPEAFGQNGGLPADAEREIRAEHGGSEEGTSGETAPVDDREIRAQHTGPAVHYEWGRRDVAPPPDERCWVRFRSAGGSNDMESRVTLCAFHQRGASRTARGPGRRRLRGPGVARW